ncbi:MAG: F0F1 ATP synthase subunit C [Desulfovibrionaceae bacterium]|nr:F0F1 ATP synthase subunit C [Desulfovibrionaceae bacterium]
MRRIIVSALAILTVLVIGTAAMAQTADGGVAKAFLDAGALGMTCAGVAIGMGAACGGCGAGMGAAVAGTCVATARNPELGGRLFVLLLLGLALIESLAIYALVINLILLYANPFVA